MQSIPGPGQSPVVFETSADLTALASWNALPAETTVPWSLAENAEGTWFAGTSNNLNVGDALLFVAAPGGTVDVTQNPAAELHFITAVSTDSDANTTQVTWDAQLTSVSGSDVNVYVFRKKAALFGANAGVASATTKSNTTAGTTTTTSTIGPPSYQSWADPYAVILDTTYPGLGPSPGGPQWLALTLTETTNVVYTHLEGILGSEAAVSTGDTPTRARTTAGITGTLLVETTTYAALFTIGSAQDENPQRYNLSSRATALTVGDTALPLVGFPETPDTSDPSATGLLNTYIGATPQVTAYVQSEQLTGAPLPLANWIVRGQSLNLVGGQQIPPGQLAALSGKRVRLQIPVGANSTFTPADASGGSSMDGQVVLLDSSQQAYDQAGNTLWSVITTSGVAGTLLLPSQPGAPAVTSLPADKGDPVASEAVIIQSATPSAGVIMLQLDAPLSRLYDASTVNVNANAVRATHGQTVQEILGSGDATNATLSFTLKQVPLTYLPAPAASGVQSTLQVWVNNLRWQEAPNLLWASPTDRVYTTSADATGHTVVRFGDGSSGGRPPTGQANIRAVYRTGTGIAGMVGAGQLTQPLDRPQGLSSVTNPSAATGGQDPATADEVRASAPLPTLTIGRVVSLEDYQDFALGFAGIAKALATSGWSGDTRGVLLTVAGAAGAVLASGDPVLSSLATALRQSGDPYVPLTIVPHVPVLFTFTAGLAINTTTYDPSAVLLQAWQAVAAAFAFGARDLGQGVAGSEIVEILQGVPGVLAVQLPGLQRSGDSAAPAPVLRAAGPRPPLGAQPTLGAELLLLDPATYGQLVVWS